jgi:hypothetical protein
MLNFVRRSGWQLKKIILVLGLNHVFW